MLSTFEDMIQELEMEWPKIMKTARGASVNDCGKSVARTIKAEETGNGIAMFNWSEQNEQDNGENDGTNNRRPDGTQPGRADQDMATSLGGKPAPRGWSSATRISREGRPITVYRGSDHSLNVEHFEKSSLGKASGNPSSGLGVWFILRVVKDGVSQ